MSRTLGHRRKSVNSLSPSELARDGLENCCTGNRTRGSNPSPSASLQSKLVVKEFNAALTGTRNQKANAVCKQSESSHEWKAHWRDCVPRAGGIVFGLRDQHCVP